MMLARFLAISSIVFASHVHAAPAEKERSSQNGVTRTESVLLQNKKIYQMSPAELGSYLNALHASEPDLRKGIAILARKNIGQPYSLNLLGEFPFELHDNLPMYSLTHSDCLVFVEHTYAMALSSSWEEFFWTLQRIRYKDGLIGVATRNHYTEVDWNSNNAWLVQDISAKLAGSQAVSYDITVDRAKFLKERHHTIVNIPEQTSREFYVKTSQVNSILDQLQDGDFVNVVSNKEGYYSVTHVGLVVVDANGKRNFINSAEPQVREESFDTFIARTQERTRTSKVANPRALAGFKFLRLRDDIVIPPSISLPRPSH